MTQPEKSNIPEFTHLLIKDSYHFKVILPFDAGIKFIQARRFSLTVDVNYTGEISLEDSKRYPELEIMFLTTEDVNSILLQDKLTED